jgi:hypothetical protein
MLKLVKLGATLSAAITAVACATAPVIAQEPGTGIPIAVVAEDSDPNSVARSSDIFYRVISEMQDSLARENFYVLDEGFMMGALDWKTEDRRARNELAGMMDLACRAGDATICPRAMVIMKIRAFAKDMGYGTRAQVRVSGDVFDRQTNRFLGSWEAPTMVFPAPADCTGVCIEEVVGAEARDIAISVGEVLRNKLARYNEAEAGTAAPSSVTTPAVAPVTGASAQNTVSTDALVNRYKIDFKHFGRSEIDEFMSIMTNEFPDFVKIDGIQGPAENRTVNYATRAPMHKMDEWLGIMLDNLGYLEGHVTIQIISEREILVDRVVGTPAQNSGPRRYN